MALPVRLRHLIRSVTDAQDRHRERHRPTGFRFAIADSVDMLNPEHWDRVVAGGSIFASRAYHQVMARSGPVGAVLRHALIYRGDAPVAAVTAQILDVTGDRVVRPGEGDLPEPARRARDLALGRLQQRVLICGNVMSWGLHGVHFAAGESPAELWPAVAEALYRVRRAERLSGQADYIVVKDMSDEHMEGCAPLARFSYRPMATGPDMVLDLPPAWRRYDDYLASLNQKYRKAARKLARDVEAAGLRVEALTDLEGHRRALHALYHEVERRAPVRLASMPEGYLPDLAACLGPERFRCTVIRRGDALVGFVTTLRDGDTAIGYYLGLDYAVNEEAPIYHRLLQAVVADAIDLGARRLSLGRTAVEPKARLGARPAPMHAWLRHRLPALNLVIRQLLHVVPQPEIPDRSPFKAEQG
ncbi:MAG: GNAT family N-acetyltransferase [Nannocystaceae bacterium]